MRLVNHQKRKVKLFCIKILQIIQSREEHSCEKIEYILFWQVFGEETQIIKNVMDTNCCLQAVLPTTLIVNISNFLMKKKIIDF